MSNGMVCTQERPFSVEDEPSPTDAPRACPWEPEQGFAARLAIGSLQKFFLKNLTRDGRVQLETLFCTVGALAGFAAQHAVRRETDDLLVVESRSGECFYFGDRLNAILVPQRPGDLTVWSAVAGEALRLGTPEHELPDCPAIFERVTKSTDAPEFGVPQTPPGHRPWLMPRKAVEIFWPAVVTAFTREPVVPVPEFKLVAPRHWPLALAVVGAGYLALAKDSGTRALSVALFMEAAISMSKIDRAAVKFAGTAAH